MHAHHIMHTMRLKVQICLCVYCGSKFFLVVWEEVREGAKNENCRVASPEILTQLDFVKSLITKKQASYIILRIQRLEGKQ